ncbi:DUF1217 domain-containing protein [Hyphomicrobium sp.]|uniref:DUF1217 domain-containing protein n=1 Tax=Hyphomicrobium sp. TaxID=82 RepID=UPI002FE047A3
MISTFLSYRMYTADYGKAVQRTLANAQVAREQAYYRENIGKVTSVDDFLKDQRLYAYAMKAYGLEDMTYAKAFMRKVLESDVTDQNSFVRKLTDQRYVEFARAFNFKSDGTVKAGTSVVQDTSDLATLVGLYSEQRLRKGTAVTAEVEYYQARMATIASADQFVADARLFEFALTAYGIDASIASESAIKQVISGDLSAVATSPNLDKYEKLAAAFSFQADGSLALGEQAQTGAQMLQTVYLNYDANGAARSASAAAFNTGVYNGLIGSLTSVDDLVDNDLLRDYVVIAAGIDPLTVSKQMVRDILTSDLSDPDSYANTKTEYAKLASMFNFNTDGSLDAGVLAQTEEQQQETVTAYYANYESEKLATEKSNTEDYKTLIGLVSNVDDLINDTRAYKYILDAFGIDRNSVTKATIRKVLTSDPNSSTSYANLTRDPRFKAMAAAFNFGADGKAQGQLVAQYSSAQSKTIALYEDTLGQYDFQKEAGQVEIDYYSSVLESVESVDDLLADKRVVTFLKKAYGFEKETSPLFLQTLRAALTSDASDATSFVNRAGNERFREIASAFNFASDGSVKRVTLGSVQDPNALVETQDLFLRQTMEVSAGEQNEGVRLALYFQRKAESITSGYSILADKALFAFVTTALSLPDAVANMDTDMLAALLEKRINFEDFKDPAKLDKFIARFTALYDMENQQSTTSIPSLLLGQTGIVDISQDLLTSVQAMYARF